MMLFALKRYFSAAGSIPKLLCLPLGLLSAALLGAALRLPGVYEDFLAGQTVSVRNALTLEGIQGLITAISVVFGIGSALCFAGMVIGFIRKPKALSVLRSCFVSVYLLGLAAFFAVLRVTGVVLEAELSKPQPQLDAVAVFYWRWSLLWPVFAVMIVIGIAHLLSWRRSGIAVYSEDTEGSPAPGDLLLENIRTHGRDPRFRKSLFSAVALHFAVVVLPLMLLWLKGGCIEEYIVPYGEGEPVVISIVRQVQPKKTPELRRIFNPMSAIIFHEPDFDRDSDVHKQVEEHTQLTWVADPTAVHGKLGAGGGTKGGWPDGMKDGVVRFILLEYNGEEWDNGMDMTSRAYLNFLDEFHRATGFKVAGQIESHPIRDLAKYPKGRAPPFVFMTGLNRINVSQRDIKILREYLLDGGMLFANCGGVRWHRNFVSFMQAVFPGEQLLVISDDDPIYQFPYTFPHGAPPFWHLGGFEAMGIRRGNRWAVYYHPGDVKDAWKTGHSGLRPELARQGFQLGINIVYHAFTHYLDATRKYRR